MFGFIGLVIVAVVGLLTASWVWFAIALMIHATGTTIVLRSTARATQTGTESDAESDRLARAAKRAAGRERASLEDELEALKHEAPSHPAQTRE